MKVRSTRKRRSRRELGTVLLILMMEVTITLILMTSASQAWTVLAQREREAELVFRGQQIARGLLLYSKDHAGTFPASLDQLMEPGPRGGRYLRRMFTDPMAEDGEWGLLYLSPTGRGVFNPNAPEGERQVPIGDPAGFGQDATQGQDDGNRRGRVGRSRGGRSRGGQTRPSGGPLPGSFGRGGGLGRGGPNGTGLPVVGVVSKSDEESFRIYNGRTSYNQWLFSAFDQSIAGGPAQLPGAQPQNPVNRFDPLQRNLRRRQNNR